MAASKGFNRGWIRWCTESGVSYIQWIDTSMGKSQTTRHPMFLSMWRWHPIPLEERGGNPVLKRKELKSKISQGQGLAVGQPSSDPAGQPDRHTVNQPTTKHVRPGWLASGLARPGLAAVITSFLLMDWRTTSFL